MSGMPIYEYRCPKGHQFEVFQSMSDDAVDICEVCGAAGVQRVFHPIAIHFKGSGFHNTDYGKGRKSKTSSEEGSSSGSEKPDGKDKKKDAKSSESTKSESKAPAASTSD